MVVDETTVVVDEMGLVVVVGGGSVVVGASGSSVVVVDGTSGPEPVTAELPEQAAISTAATTNRKVLCTSQR